MNERRPFLVLGVGNELFTDEGVGIAAARAIGARELPEVEVLDGGTLGMDLLPEIDGREGVLVLDALAARGAAPGEVLVLEGERMPTGPGLLFSAHQIGVLEALAAAEFVGRAPARVAAVGMVPASLQTGYGISGEASLRLGEMVGRALDVLERWGVAECGERFHGSPEGAREGEAAYA